MRLCLLGDDPVLLEHGRRLAARHDVAAVASVPEGGGLRTLTPEAAEAERFDVAVADGWRTTTRLLSIQAQRHVRHVSQLDARVIPPWHPDRMPAVVALDLPLDFTAESEGIAGYLRELRPGARVALVPPPAPDGAAAVGDGAALRVRVEGDRDTGREVVAATPHAVEASDSAADVVLALGEPGPAARIAASAFAGHAALVMDDGPLVAGLVEHRVNGLVTDADDSAGAARMLAGLARDRELVTSLREGAAATHAQWPGAEAAASAFEAALTGFLEEAPPEASRWPVRVMGDAVAYAVGVQAELDALRAELESLRGERAYQAALRLRSILKRG